MTSTGRILAALIRVILRAPTIDAVRQGVVFANARTIAARPEGLGDLPWTPFVEAVPERFSPEAIAAIARDHGVTPSAVAHVLADIEHHDRIMINSRYQVAIRDTVPDLRHLSIKRIDQAPIHDWRDLQRIKDELVGPECEGIEVYPAQSRLVDTSNQYHIWCVRDPAYRFPFGFDERLVTDFKGAHLQRPFET